VRCSHLGYTPALPANIRLGQERTNALAYLSSYDEKVDGIVCFAHHFAASIGIDSFLPSFTLLTLDQILQNFFWLLTVPFREQALPQYFYILFLLSFVVIN